MKMVDAETVIGEITLGLCCFNPDFFLNAEKQLFVRPGTREKTKWNGKTLTVKIVCVEEEKTT